MPDLGVSTITTAKVMDILGKPDGHYSGDARYEVACPFRWEKFIDGANTYEWGHTVKLTTYHKTGQLYKLEIAFPFKGSIRGLHVGDPEARAFELGRKYPQPGKQRFNLLPSSGLGLRCYVNIDHPWRIEWNSGEQKMQTVALVNTRFSVGASDPTRGLRELLEE